MRCGRIVLLLATTCLACTGDPAPAIDGALADSATGERRVDARARDAGPRDGRPPEAGDASSADALQPPWPAWALQHWVWEDESTQQSALALVNDYLSRNIPVSAIIIDSPWETGYNTFVFDTQLFPDPQQMVTDLHAKNVKVMLWIVPAINTDVTTLYAEGKSKDYFMKLNPIGDPAVISWWKGKGSLLDYFNPSAVAWWHKLVDQALAYGIDGWKCDGLDISAWQAPWSPGKLAIVPRLTYSDAYYRDFFDYTRKKLGKDRIITARPVDTYGLDPGPLVKEASFAPVDVSWAGWVGDQDATFAGLRAALLNMYYSAQLGYIAFGSDIGGYREDKTYPTTGRSKELFIRWAQLGALSPVMENGGGGEHRPWKFDQETTDIYRSFVKLHHALVPYLMTEGAKAYTQKKSLMSFLDKTDFRFLLGPDVFVTPMIASGTSRTVKLPTGSDWVYLFDKQKVYTGGSSATLTVPIDEYPVFLRKGSTLASTLSVP